MPPTKKTTAAKKTTARNQPADANLPITDARPTTQPNAGGPTRPAEGSAPGPGAGDPTALSGTRAADAGDTVARYAGDITGDAGQAAAGRRAPRVSAGDVVALAPTDDTTDGAPAQHVLVVDRVEGTEHRDDGALIVALPEARWVPLSALATD
jgi:hypothetical protein